MLFFLSDEDIITDEELEDFIREADILINMFETRQSDMHWLKRFNAFLIEKENIFKHAYGVGYYDDLVHRVKAKMNSFSKDLPDGLKDVLKQNNFKSTNQ